MSEQKKYYWLKLKEDFFNDDTIQWIEDQENGKEYCLFYLKLCLKSLRTDGILIRNVGNMLIPYDIKKLSEITNTEKDTVRVAMELFKGIGLVQVLESGALYLSQLENMVGAETKWAEKKRKQRQVLNSKDNVLLKSPKCPREIEKDIEIEKDKELDKDIETEKDKSMSSVVCSNIEVFKHFEKCGFMVSSMLMEKISADIEVYGSKNLMDAATESMERGKMNNYKYVIGIVQNWQTEGRKDDKNGSTSKPTKNTESEEPKYNFKF